MYFSIRYAPANINVADAAAHSSMSGTQDADVRVSPSRVRLAYKSCSSTAPNPSLTAQYKCRLEKENFRAFIISFSSLFSKKYYRVMIAYGVPRGKR